VADSPHGFALVVGADATLVGRLRAAALAGDPAARTEQIMEAGPSTVRPDRPLVELVEVMRGKNLTVMLVTTPEGRLLGVLPRDLAEQTLNASENRTG
jgi:CBS domain-containing protein